MTREEEAIHIELACAGDRHSAELFIRAHQRSLYAYILRMSGRPEVAEDIVQEAFVRVLSNLDRFDTQYRFSTWLFTIARRLYINAMQKHKPSSAGDATEGWSASSRRGSFESWSPSSETEPEVRDVLQRAMMRLSEEQREVLVLFHQLNWPIALIARHVDIPEGTVKSHLHRGRRRLRAIIEADERSSRVVGDAMGLAVGMVGENGEDDFGGDES
ncbi:MAG: RNA polymerase sigma factor [Phycisphaerales bacterium]|jgi:RNA polymerase sigma-70 factor (ECF subfamily)|nr:RNA polymerase sigma factor [Phycisphaerales bacterium]